MKEHVPISIAVNEAELSAIIADCCRRENEVRGYGLSSSNEAERGSLEAHAANLLVLGHKLRALRDEGRKNTAGALADHQDTVGVLWDADPDCWHEMASSGVRCKKCGGWFCY